MGSPVLTTESVTITFGGLCAVDHVHFYVERGETVGLIGPNGSGKSTFFNLVTGIYRPTFGAILFEGQNLVGQKPHEIARKGIARTFQNNRLFSDISVLDNVILGMHSRQRSGLLDTLFRYRNVRLELKAGAEKAAELLSFFSEELRDSCFKRVMDLPHADRRRVEICRALASDPRLLLLDEPAGGMSPEETEELMRDIRKVKEKNRDLSLVVIEHDMEVIEKIADRVYVFNYGKKIAEGPFSSVSKDPQVIEAYLGEEGKMLRLEKVTTQYEDSVIVLRDISLTVEKGRITCLLGSNGAGKTTMLRTIVNQVRPLRGRIFFEDSRIDQLKTHQIIKLGISVVPEGRRLFPEFTVYDNLRIGAFSERDLGAVREKMEDVFRIFAILRERTSQLAGTLSGGEQGMLSIARALMAGPRVLLLDEPSLGLAPIVVREVFRVISRINEEGITILLIEQNARKAISIASKGYVLQKGTVVAEGTSEILKKSDILRAAYLRGRTAPPNDRSAASQ